MPEELLSVYRMHMTGVTISLSEYRGPAPRRRRWWHRWLLTPTDPADLPYLAALDRDDLVLLTGSLRDRQERLEKAAMRKARQEAKRRRR